MLHNKEKMKGLLVALGSGAGPKEDKENEPSESGPDKAHDELASKLISAVKSGDAAAFSASLKDFIYLCQEGDNSDGFEEES